MLSWETVNSVFLVANLTVSCALVYMAYKTREERIVVAWRLLELEDLIKEVIALKVRLFKQLDITERPKCEDHN